MSDTPSSPQTLPGWLRLTVHVTAAALSGVAAAALVLPWFHAGPVVGGAVGELAVDAPLVADPSVAGGVTRAVAVDSLSGGAAAVRAATGDLASAPAALLATAVVGALLWAAVRTARVLPAAIALLPALLAWRQRGQLLTVMESWAAHNQVTGFDRIGAGATLGLTGASLAIVVTVVAVAALLWYRRRPAGNTNRGSGAAATVGVAAAGAAALGAVNSLAEKTVGGRLSFVDHLLHGHDTPDDSA